VTIRFPPDNARTRRMISLVHSLLLKMTAPSTICFQHQERDVDTGFGGEHCSSLRDRE
jgi:hypothetical protein